MVSIHNWKLVFWKEPEHILSRFPSPGRLRRVVSLYRLRRSIPYSTQNGLEFVPRQWTKTGMFFYIWYISSFCFWVIMEDITFSELGKAIDSSAWSWAILARVELFRCSHCMLCFPIFASFCYFLSLIVGFVSDDWEWALEIIHIGVGLHTLSVWFFGFYRIRNHALFWFLSKMPVTIFYFHFFFFFFFSILYFEFILVTLNQFTSSLTDYEIVRGLMVFGLFMYLYFGLCCV